MKKRKIVSEVGHILPIPLVNHVSREMICYVAQSMVTREPGIIKHRCIVIPHMGHMLFEEKVSEV